MFFFLYSSSSSKTLFICNFSQCVGLHAIRLHCIVAIGLVTKWSFGIHFPKIEKNKLFVVRHFLARFFLVTVVKLETKTARSVNTSGNSSARIASSSKSDLTFLSFFFYIFNHSTSIAAYRLVVSGCGCWLCIGACRVHWSIWSWPQQPILGSLSGLLSLLLSMYTVSQKNVTLFIFVIT